MLYKNDFDLLSVSFPEMRGKILATLEERSYKRLSPFTVAVPFFQASIPISP